MDPLPLSPSAGHWPGISPPWSTSVLSSAPLLEGPGNSPLVPTVGRGTRPGGSRRSGGAARVLLLPARGCTCRPSSSEGPTAPPRPRRAFGRPGGRLPRPPARDPVRGWQCPSGFSARPSPSRRRRLDTRRARLQGRPGTNPGRVRSGAATRYVPRYVPRPRNVRILRFRWGGLIGQKLDEGQRPPEHRSFRVTPISGRFGQFHRGGKLRPREAVGADFVKMRSRPRWRQAPSSHPALGCASRRRGRGGRNSSGSREQRSDFRSSAASPRPQRPRFLREDLGKTRRRQETLYLGAREGGREGGSHLDGWSWRWLHSHSFRLKKNNSLTPPLCLSLASPQGWSGRSWHRRPFPASSSQDWREKEPLGCE